MKYYNSKIKGTIDLFKFCYPEALNKLYEIMSCLDAQKHFL
jgi:hypothetical protein